MKLLKSPKRKIHKIIIFSKYLVFSTIVIARERKRRYLVNPFAKTLWKGKKLGKNFDLVIVVKMDLSKWIKYVKSKGSRVKELGCVHLGVLKRLYIRKQKYNYN